MNLLFIIAIIFAIKQILKETFEKPAPKGTRFDWDVYWEDVNNGMSSMEQVRKRQRGGYMTTEPLPEKKNTKWKRNVGGNIDVPFLYL